MPHAWVQVSIPSLYVYVCVCVCVCVCVSHRYLVEHVSGFMLSAFRDPGAAILWSLQLQELMLHENWYVSTHTQTQTHTHKYTYIYTNTPPSPTSNVKFCLALGVN